MDKKTALIVDDSSLARMMVKKIFGTEFQDWELLEAQNGAEALVKIAGVRLHLALIDFNMPGMNGIDLAEQIMGQQSNLPIYLVTANIQERMRLRAEAMGIGFIKKPVSQEKIAGLIATLVG